MSNAPNGTTKEGRLALIRYRHKYRIGFGAMWHPSNIPTKDDMPEAEVADLNRTYEATMEIDKRVQE